jgi:hypothetical protein
MSITLLTATIFLAQAQGVLSKQEALDLHFVGLQVDRKTVFLNNEQVQEIQSHARAKVLSKVLTYYVGRKEGETVGYAFFETQTVRTMPETYMVVVNPDGTVRVVELLAFFEPEDYRPPAKWLDQFDNVSTSSNLWLKRGIHNIVGATLTAQSITEGVRRVLAAFELIVLKEDRR